MEVTKTDLTDEEWGENARDYRINGFSLLILEAYYRLELNRLVLDRQASSHYYDDDGYPSDEEKEENPPDYSSHMEELWGKSDDGAMALFSEVTKSISHKEWFLEMLYDVALIYKITGMERREESPLEIFKEVLGNFVPEIKKEFEVEESDYILRKFMETLFKAINNYGYGPSTYEWPRLEIQRRIYGFSKYFLGEEVDWGMLGAYTKESLEFWEQTMVERFSFGQELCWGMIKTLEGYPLKGLLEYPLLTDDGLVNLEIFREKAKEIKDLETLQDKIESILSPAQKSVFLFWVKNKQYVFSAYEGECLKLAIVAVLKAL